MKFQFSIAGVMGLTVVVALGLWSLLYANFLFAHVATSSLLAGGFVGWIVGACYGQSERGCIAGVLGALPWTCAAALLDLHAWSRAHRFQAWGGLAVIAALGAVPMASTAAVYERSARELIVRPLITCTTAMLIAGLIAAFSLAVFYFFSPSSSRWGYRQMPRIIIFVVIRVLLFGGVGAFVGAGYALAALALRFFEREGRKYRDARIVEPASSKTITAEHIDPASVDRQ